MWKLTTIQAENLCAFRHLEYTLKQGVTTLIFGHNKDNDSQQSNGAGKSALLECIAIGITGSPLRKIRSEEIINDSADVCNITLSLANDSSNETLVIRRTIPRKGASTVSCSIETAESGVTEIAQPSVDAYNKYILERIGITREELLNNFILSKYRYEDFLSSSDKEKKEIINRFSNGILVDEAILKVEEDIAPLEDKRQETNLELAGIDGRIDMLQEQIAKQTAESEERGRNRQTRIAELEASIASKREQIRELSARMDANEKQQGEADKLDDTLQDMEASELPLKECLDEIEKLFPNTDRTDWNSTLAAKQQALLNTQKQISDCDRVLEELSLALQQKSERWEQFKSNYQAFSEYHTAGKQAISDRLMQIDSQLRNLSLQMEELRRKRHIISAGVDELHNKLAGMITCPACKHQFLVAEPQFDIEAGMKELKLRQSNLSEVISCINNRQNETEEVELTQNALRSDYRNMDAERRRQEEEYASIEKELRSAANAVDDAENKRRRIMTSLVNLQEEIEGIRRKVFDEVFDILDARKSTLKREAIRIKEDVHAAECAIETLQSTIRELRETSIADLTASLAESLKKEQAKSQEVASRKIALDDKLRQLEIQRERFVQFKTYLANTKIEALSRITNEFLVGIGSDIRIRFDGYTVLKSGKVREKISISLLRDGVDCGSFGKFSAGEAARVNLATILAMQKLVNANCDDDKGLGLLVLDEILEAVDETGLSSMFEALNSLGTTVLVVSHGNIAESYPHKLIITKENGESRIG